MGQTRKAPSRLPLYYFGLAHICLAAAGALLCSQPWTYSGFFYHHRMMVPVHLITLGWVTASILGALYMLSPMAFRTRIPEGPLDRWLVLIYAMGLSGMLSHFWLASYGGMVWSAGLVILSVLTVGLKILRALRDARIAPGVKQHIALAFLNFLIAAATGALLGLAKAGIVLLPLRPLPTVYAHVHLAVLGWATLMVFGVGYRLLPMILPAAVPSGWRVVVGAWIFEVGVLGLYVSLLLGLDHLRWPSAVLTTLGILIFFSNLIFMVLNPRPAPKDRPKLEWGRVHIFMAVFHLLVTVICGWILIAGGLSERLILRLMPVYGVCALLGFLGQMVFGVLARLWPLYVWQADFARRTDASVPPSPWKTIDPRLLAGVFFSWLLAVPLLAWGLFTEHPGSVGGAGFLIFVAAIASATHLVSVALQTGSAVLQPGNGPQP